MRLTILVAIAWIAWQSASTGYDGAAIPWHQALEPFSTRWGCEQSLVRHAINKHDEIAAMRFGDTSAWSVRRDAWAPYRVTYQWLARTERRERVYEYRCWPSDFRP